MPLIEAVFQNPLNATFWSELASIIVIDLVLAGDNAIVIAFAARNLPRDHQFRAIFWGTAGAILVRVAMTAGVIWLLKIPGLMLAGGLLLIPIAWRLLKHNDTETHESHAARGFWGAIFTIMAADALTGLDNVLGITGASGGHLGLVVTGLLVSVPLVVWGATRLMRLIERFPMIILIGAGAIAWTAARMLTHDHLVDKWFDAHDPARYAVGAVLVISVVGIGWLTRKRGARQD
jgi:YjbE family integral membrane protein